MSTAPGTIVRNLTFQSENLGRETTILLVFDTDMEGLYDTIYPVVWKAITFPARGSYSYDVTYTDNFAFSKADIGHDNLVRTFRHFELKPGQKTTLSLKDNNKTRFSPPVNAIKDYLTAENETGFLQDLAVGFYNPSKAIMAEPELLFFKEDGEWKQLQNPSKATMTRPDPMLFFKEVKDGGKATAQWKPVLRIYVESDYQETEVLVNAIKGTAILEQDLRRLFRNTVFNLERNTLTRRFKLTKTKP
ncbi:hypothetical protein C8R48DRAFT_706065 [Suillus tomentosus]|nr:hypothetical protein C8R48DRAFT_706065 [Suillus tomentosus]